MLNANTFKSLFEGLGLSTEVNPHGNVASKRVSKHGGNTKRRMYTVRQERRAANRVAKQSRKVNR